MVGFIDKGNQSTPEKTTDMQQVNNKLITPHHRKLQTCNKSTTNLSHLITENYRPATSQQQTYHISSQKTTDLWQVNNKLITPHHRNQSTPEKTTALWQVNNKLITPHHRKLQTCDKSTTNLSHLITETRVHRRKPQTCDKSTINLSHLITENYRTVTSC